MLGFLSQLVTTKAVAALLEGQRRFTAASLVAELIELLMYVSTSAPLSHTDDVAHSCRGSFPTPRERKRWSDARALLEVNSALAHLAGWDNLAVALRILQRECERSLDDWGAYVCCRFCRGGRHHDSRHRLDAAPNPRARNRRVVSTCLALLTAGALGISDEARRGQMTFMDDLLDAIGKLPFMHMRAGHPLIALALPPLVSGEYTLPSVAADDTGVPTVTVQLQSRLPRAITLDKVALVVDRVDSTNAVREYSDAFECGPIELAPNSTTAVKLSYKVRPWPPDSALRPP